jgi:hypothetical protein
VIVPPAQKPQGVILGKQMSTRMTKDTAVEDTCFFIIFDKVCIFFWDLCSSLKNATLFFDNYKKMEERVGEISNQIKRERGW